VLIRIPLCILSALKANTWIDTSNQFFLLLFYAISFFVVGVIVQLVFLQLDLNGVVHWPVSGWGNPWQYSLSDIQYKLLPILVYAATGIAYYARLTRTSMLEVLRQDYVRTARAKGMLERVVIYRHALRNATIPL